MNTEQRKQLLKIIERCAMLGHVGAIAEPDEHGGYTLKPDYDLHTWCKIVSFIMFEVDRDYLTMAFENAPEAIQGLLQSALSDTLISTLEHQCALYGSLREAFAEYIEQLELDEEVINMVPGNKITEAEKFWELEMQENEGILADIQYEALSGRG